MSTDPNEPPAPGDDRLTGHCYDGIEEYDNPMPKWWLWGLYASILFSLVYWLEPTRALAGQGREAEYAAEQAAFLRAHPVQQGIDPTTLLAAAADRSRDARGKAVYSKNCAACHRADGGGLIGPNLTDDYWMHGATPPEVYTTIDAGVLAKGMPAWGKLLQPEELLDVLAYVHSLEDDEVLGGKEPQGVQVDSDDGSSKEKDGA